VHRRCDVAVRRPCIVLQTRRIGVVDRIKCVICGGLRRSYGLRFCSGSLLGFAVCLSPRPSNAASSSSTRSSRPVSPPTPPPSWRSPSARRRPSCSDPELVDGDGREHPGLIDRGLPILRGSRAQLAEVAARAAGGDASIVGLPTFGQQTTDYASFRERLAVTPGADVVHLALLVHGPKRTVTKLTGSLGLLR
jgi:hypothetical protein